MQRTQFARKPVGGDGEQRLPSFYPYSPVDMASSSVNNNSSSSSLSACKTRPLRRKLPTSGVKLAATAGLGSLAIFVLVWRHLFALDVGEAIPTSQGRLGAENTFTVRMNTWRRNDLLKKSAEHYASCTCVGQIQVVWSDQENKPPRLELFREEARAKIAFEVHDTNSLNHRFNVTSPLDTMAIFSTDDDLEIPCEDLQFAFEAWQSSQLAMVGFSPRVVTQDIHTGRHRYRSWRVVRWNGMYNVILTKCCFLHRDHLRTYVEKMPLTALSYIDDHRNCEDIAMSMVVAKYFGTPPLWVKGKFKEIGQNGISALPDHFEARSQCVDFFASQFDGMPLIGTSSKVYPIRTGLLSWL